MMVPHTEYSWDLKLITTALTKTSIPERISMTAETLALDTASPKLVERTLFPTKLLKVAAEAVYLMIPLVEAFANPPMKVKIPARSEIA